MHLSQKKKKLAALFFEVGAFKVNVLENYTLTSGKKSPVYFDHRVLMSLPSVRNLVAEVWAEELKEVFESLSVSLDSVIVAGTVSAGIAPAFLLAQNLNATFAYVRTAPKAYGMGNQWEGMHPTSGSKILLIDDMITTGKSVSGAALGVQNVCKSAGASFLGVSCITRHPFSDTIESVKQLSEKKVFHSCFESNTLLNVGQELGILSLQEIQICNQWLKNMC
jgi:orotate phosphoribosyltransferase